MINLKTIDQHSFNGEVVLLRVDFNVPINNGKVSSNFRIIKSLNTIRHLMEKRCKIILVSHLGRPKNVDPAYSLKPVFDELKEILGSDVGFYDGELKKEKIEDFLKDFNIIMLENIRFQEGETKNDLGLSKSLASIADIFVNDAFGVTHRRHASSYGVAQIIPAFSGLLVFEEVHAINNIITSPDKPLTLIMGGAKVSDKILLIENFIKKGADKFIIGGGMAFTFIKALGGKIGDSIVENDKVDYCKELIKKMTDKNIKLVLPVDFVCAKSISDKNVNIYPSGCIPPGYAGFDIGPKSIKIFNKEIKKSATIIWNGPMGVFELNKFKNGTMSIIKSISKSSAYKFVGGGDSVSAIEKYNKKINIDHISTGGGASLEMLSGSQLPGIKILEKSE